MLVGTEVKGGRRPSRSDRSAAQTLDRMTTPDAELARASV